VVDLLNMPDTLANEIFDCHVHVVGSVDAFPQAEGRGYTAGLATPENLQAVANPTGVKRFVFVQPSFYGTDNSYLLHSLDLLRGNARGVVVLEPREMTPGQMELLSRRGVCGIRVNLYSKFSPLSPGGLDDLLKRYTDKMPRAGWHIEVIAPVETVAAAASALSDSPNPIVIDHYGLPGDEAPESEMGRRLLSLVSLPHVWVKVSAPYRMGADPLATKPPADWLTALLRVAPDRCVWGSDWPFAPQRKNQTDAATSVPYRPIEYRRLLEDFIRVLPGAADADRILRRNPARLYEFDLAKSVKE
jgi:predicted TIM-barrel fold metal-dependent hydrolase